VARRTARQHGRGRRGGRRFGGRSAASLRLRVRAEAGDATQEHDKEKSARAVRAAKCRRDGSD
jgi:hypothetical protein